MSLREMASIRNVPLRIRRIIDLASELQRTDVEEALNASREAVRLSRQQKDGGLLGASLRTLGLSRYYAREYRDALTALEEAQRLYEKKREWNTLARTLQNIGLCHVRLGQLEGALAAYTRSEELFVRTKDEANRALVLINMAVVHSTAGNPLRAFDCYSEALALLENRNDEHGIAVVSGNVGQMFIGMGDNDKGLQWMERCLDMHRKIDNPRGVGFALREIGLLQQNIGRSSIALQHFRQALTIYHETNDTAGQAEVHALLAELNRQEGRTGVAMDHCLQAQKLFASHHDNVNSARCSRLAADIDTASGDAASALENSKQAIVLIERTDNHALKAEYLVALARRLSSTKHEREHLRALNSALKISESIALHRTVSVVHDLLSEHHERNGDLKKALKHARLADHHRAVHEQQLASKQVQDLKYRVDIARVERDRELMRQQSEQYKAQLDTKSKELNTSALALAQKNEVISSLKQRLQSAARAGARDTHDVIRDLLRTIEEHLRGDKQMEGVTKQLSDFHQDFIAKISAEFPDLTPTELKICSLLKLNLNTKEIADFLCVSFKSVEVYRARIRKKLKLKEGDNLVSFIVGYDVSSA